MTPPHPKNRIALAIDIGGTKVAAGFVDSRGRILAEHRVPMRARGKARDGLRSVFEAVDALRAKAPEVSPVCAGISVAGWVDVHRGVLIGAANIPCWRNFPLAREVRKRCAVPVVLGNDANVAALAEAIWGAGRGYNNIFYVTLGTGVGTGIVFDRKIYTGRTGAAGEGGHITIDCNGPLCACGKRGCIEVYASGTGIARMAQEEFRRAPGPRTLLRSLAEKNGGKLTAEMVGQAARKGDRFARKILEEAAGRLAIWLGTAVDLIEPDIFILGGGVGHLMMKYRSRIRRELKQWAVAPQHSRIPIVEAQFGAESALAGAAALAFAAAKARAV